MIVAPEALNRLVAHLRESGTGGNMNLLLSFTTWAFHRHYNVTLDGHRRDSAADSTTHGRREKHAMRAVPVAHKVTIRQAVVARGTGYYGRGRASPQSSGKV